MLPDTGAVLQGVSQDPENGALGYAQAPMIQEDVLVGAAARGPKGDCLQDQGKDIRPLVFEVQPSYFVCSLHNTTASICIDLVKIASCTLMRGPS